jgi:signal transduction histidine kinase
MKTLLLTSDIRTEPDVVFVRQRARQIAALLGFDAHEQTRISTAVSEVARNAFLYALGGRAQFSVEGPAPDLFIIRISDHGQGIPNLSAILAGNYKSETGMGVGLLGAKKLMDVLLIETAPGQGTTVQLGKVLPPEAPKMTPALVARLGAQLAKLAPTSPMEEIRQQNSDLLRAFDELRSRQLELDRMNREVADANRRMTEVNSELASKAEALERTAAAERAARAQAEAAVATREELLAIVSHDLRNPLSSIVTSASTLERTPLEGQVGERVRKFSQIILRSADRMARLISDLLDLAQIQAGGLSLSPIAQDVAALVGEGIEMLLPLAIQKKLKLDGSVSAGLEVRCDRERVLQILSNLVGNALKFTPAGGSILIDARAIEEEAVFSVRDTGQGISDEALPRIFDRFWQAQKKSHAGIGLGLSIVKGVVEAHGGRLWVESKVGAGTTFYFTLPLVEPLPLARAAALAAQAAASSAS